MSIPTTGYDSATITNPSSALTDFTLIIDLSRMSSSWKADWNTDDNGRGRACKSDGTTELACDWIDLDHTAGTGLLRVKWTGTLASSGTQTIRIYPPNTNNTQYSASDTYGSDNAYDSDTWGYYPLSDNYDRTSNGHDLTGYNGLIFGDGDSGIIGVSTSFSQSSEQYALTASDFPFSGDFSIVSLVRSDSDTNDQGIAGKNDDYIQLWRDENGSSDRFAIYGNDGVIYGTTNPSISTWYSVGCAKNNELILYVNGLNEGSGTLATQSDSPISIGNTSIKYMDGQQQSVYLSSTNRSAAWFAEESSQTLDNATFWGTWTWTSGGSGTIYNESVSESIGLNETEGNTLNISIQSSDQVNLSDIASVVQQLSIAVSEGIGLSDYQTTGTSTTYDVSIAESINLSETQNISIVIPTSISESIGLSDTQASILDVSIDVAEGINFQDTISAVFTYAATVAESMGLTDIQTSGDLVSGRICVTISSSKPLLTITATKSKITIESEGC